MKKEKININEIVNKTISKLDFKIKGLKSDLLELKKELQQDNITSQQGEITVKKIIKTQLKLSDVEAEIKELIKC